MGKTCAHGLCNSNSLYPEEDHMRGVEFIPFPKFKTQPDKCRKWVNSCNRVDFTVSSVTRGTYICSKHFPGGCGPTKQFPDPVIAHISQYSHISNRTKKKLRVSSEPEHDLPTIESLQETASGGGMDFPLAMQGKTVESPEDSIQTRSDDSVSNVVYVSIETTSGDSMDFPLAMQGKTVESPEDPIQTRSDDAVSNVVLVTIETEQSSESIGVETRQSHDITSNLHSHAVAVPIVDKVPDTTQENLQEPQSRLDLLFKEVVSLGVPKRWACFYDDRYLTFMMFIKDIPTVSLKCNCKFQIHLTVHGEELTETHQLQIALSSECISSAQDLLRILRMFDKWRVCEGSRNDFIIDEFEKSALRRDCKVSYEAISVRSIRCKLIFPFNRNQAHCVECKKLNHRLANVVYRRRNVFAQRNAWQQL